MEYRIHLADGPTAPPTRGTVYLPIISIPPLPPIEPRPGTQADEFLALLISDSRQQRTLTKCAKLEQSALWRAYGLANGDPWSHTDSHGVTANEYVRRAGCKLPSDYSAKGNQVEDLCAGSSDVAIIYAALAGSPAHAGLLFGVGWFAHQRHVGIAMAENQASPYKWYWAVHIALCEDGC